MREGTPPTQLEGLGERCKLPQRGQERSPPPDANALLYHAIKLRTKTKIVYFSRFKCIRIAGCMYYNHQNKDA